MTIRANELPDLIAAAVKKVVDEKQLTNETLQALGKRPLTIGIIFNPAESPAAVNLEAEIRVPPHRPIGFVLQNLDELKDVDAIKSIGGEVSGG